jgi:hypothetical protein
MPSLGASEVILFGLIPERNSKKKRLGNKCDETESRYLLHSSSVYLGNSYPSLNLSDSSSDGMTSFGEADEKTGWFAMNEHAWL